MEGKPKKSIVKILIIIMLVMLLLSVACYAYLTTDILKTDKQLFVKYFISDLNQIKKFNLDPYTTVLDENKDKNLQLELKTNMTEKDLFERENKTSTNIIYKSDKTSLNKNLQVDIKENEDELINLNMFFNENEYHLKVNDLHDKYLGLEDKNLQEFIKKICKDEEILNKIPEDVENLKVVKEDINKIKDILFNKFINRITNILEIGEFSSNKNVKVKADKEEINANEYLFTIKEKDVLEEIISVFESIIADKEFLDVYLKYFDKEELENYKTSLEEYKSEIADIDENSKIKISVYANKGKNIETALKYDELEVYYQIFNEKNKSTLIFGRKEITDDAEKRKPDEELIYKISNEINQDLNGILTFENSLIYDKEDMEMLKNKDDGMFEDFWGDKISYEDYFKDYTTKIMINSTRKNNNEIESEFNFSESDLDGEQIDISFKVNLNDEIKVLDLTKEETVILNNLTEDEIKSLGEELKTNIIESSNKSLRFILEMFFDIDLMPEEEIENQNEEIEEQGTEEPIEELGEEIEESNEIIEEPNELIENSNELNEEIEKSNENFVQGSIKEALALCIAEYTADYYSNNGEEVNINNYFTVENISENVYSGITLLEFLDGNNLRCKYNEKEFNVNITIYENDGKYSVGEVIVTKVEE